MANELLDRRVYYPGDTVFKEGDTGRRVAFFVEAGKIEISKNSPTGAKILGYVETGGIFGEMALIDAAPRVAQAKAVEASTLILISEANLETKLKTTDPFIRSLFGIFVRSIKDLSTRVAEKQKAAAGMVSMPPPPSA